MKSSTFNNSVRIIAISAVAIALVLSLHIYLLRESPSAVVGPAEAESTGFDPEFEKFLSALRITEKDRNKTGAAGEVGDYQIKKIYVDDVNRILGRKEFTYGDRLDLIASRQMVTIYVLYYATGERLSRPPTFLDLARLHKGGPDGCWREATVEGAQRVVNLMSIMECSKDREVTYGRIGK